MTERSSMSALIIELRGMVHAGIEEYTVFGIDYWSNEQLQAILDRNRIDLYRCQLDKVPRTAAGGAVQYFDHWITGYDHFERTDGGTAIFYIEDAAGNDQGTALWSADYNVGLVTFAQDTGGTALYVTARSYDLPGAAAEVWRQKTGHFAAGPEGFDFSTDNMSVKRSQRVEQAQYMANYYAGQMRPKVTQIFRSDVNAGSNY